MTTLESNRSPLTLYSLELELLISSVLSPRALVPSYAMSQLLMLLPTAALAYGCMQMQMRCP